MRIDYKEGDEVVCIDAKPRVFGMFIGIVPGAVEGKIYRVIKMAVLGDVVMTWVDGLEYGGHAERFRKVDKPTTSIEIFEKMLHRFRKVENAA